MEHRVRQVMRCRQRKPRRMGLLRAALRILVLSKTSKDDCPLGGKDELTTLAGHIMSTTTREPQPGLVHRTSLASTNVVPFKMKQIEQPCRQIKQTWNDEQCSHVLYLKSAVLLPLLALAAGQPPPPTPPK